VARTFVVLRLALSPRGSRSGSKNARVRLMDAWRKLRVYLARRLGKSPEFIWVVEAPKRGSPVLHVLTNPGLPRSWLVETWLALGGERSITAHQMHIERAVKHLSTRMTTAGKGSRRVGHSRNEDDTIGLVRRGTRVGIWIAERRSDPLRRFVWFPLE
jgi:hypothetical protein